MTTDIPDHQINVPELRKQLEYITAHLDTWWQGTWVRRTACGTVACLAGNTVLNAGWTPVYSHRAAYSAIVVKSPDGQRIEGVQGVARELLELSDEDADRLFHGANTLLDLWTIAHDITDGEIEIPENVRNGEIDLSFTGKAIIDIDTEIAEDLTEQQGFLWNRPQDAIFDPMFERNPLPDVNKDNVVDNINFIV